MCSKKVKNREWQRPETTFSEKAGENGRKCVLWPHERVSCRDTRIDRNNHSSWITRLDKNVYRFNGLNSMQWVQHIYFALQSLITHNHTKSDFKLKSSYFSVHAPLMWRVWDFHWEFLLIYQAPVSGATLSHTPTKKKWK